jgi:hypothetical protein
VESKQAALADVLIFVGEVGRVNKTAQRDGVCIPNLNPVGIKAEQQKIAVVQVNSRNEAVITADIIATADILTQVSNGDGSQDAVLLDPD